MDVLRLFKDVNVWLHAFLLTLPELQSDLIVLHNITDKLVIIIRQNMLETNQISTFCFCWISHVNILRVTDLQKLAFATMF